jgi:hypothetical protein
VGDDVGFVLDDPFDDFPLLELHGLSYGGGEVDVILIGGLLAMDKLDFRGIPHVASPVFMALAYMLELNIQKNANAQEKKCTSAENLVQISSQRPNPSVVVP